MYLIQQITSSPKQKRTLILADGSQVVFTMEYKPLQLGWFITEMTYKTFSVLNLRIVTSPNMLHQFKNQIPFGMACFVKGNQEPTLAEDFSNGRAKLFILSADEVDYFEGVLNGQNTP